MTNKTEKMEFLQNTKKELGAHSKPSLVKKEKALRVASVLEAFGKLRVQDGVSTKPIRRLTYL